MFRVYVCEILKNWAGRFSQITVSKRVSSLQNIGGRAKDVVAVS